MQRYILIYGGIAGTVVIASVIGSMILVGDEHAAGLEWLGYLIMLIALSMIFVGIKRYRDEELGGVIRFGTALGLGLAMSVVASVIYVAIWEVYLAMTDHAFIDQYTEGVIAAKRADGVVGAELEEFIASMREMQAQYADPLFRMPVTFLEIFPVSVVVTLASAALLRNSRVLPARS